MQCKSWANLDHLKKIRLLLCRKNAVFKSHEVSGALFVSYRIIMQGSHANGSNTQFNQEKNKMKEKKLITLM